MDLSTPGPYVIAGAGYRGIGSITIRRGVNLQTTNGYLGYHPGSMGTATVDGAGSKWTNSGSLDVGSFYGSGTLSITNGGNVTDNSGRIADQAGSTGIVTVDGTNSKWTNTWSTSSIGGWGSATLNVSGGGAVTAPNVSINSLSLLSINVGRSSSFNLSGTLTNNGKVRIVARGCRGGLVFAPLRRHVVGHHRHLPGRRRRVGCRQPPLHRFERVVGHGRHAGFHRQPAHHAARPRHGNRDRKEGRGWLPSADDGQVVVIHGVAPQQHCPQQFAAIPPRHRTIDPQRLGVHDQRQRLRRRRPRLSFAAGRCKFQPQRFPGVVP